MIRTQADLIAWCRERRDEAERILALYEGGTTRFRSNGVDVTNEQIANVKSIIANMDDIISRTPDA